MLHFTQLGKKSTNPEHYDPSLLFAIPRSENREKYNLIEGELPFIGVDVWNSYEVSFLTTNGLPVNRMMKLIYSADSEFIIESKSLKLYLNSFNMEKMGDSVGQAELEVLNRITNDLSTTLKTKVQAVFFTANSKEQHPFAELANSDLIEQIHPDNLKNIVFEHYNERPELLNGTKTVNIQSYGFHTDVLRSNCRVTNQADWGDLFVNIETIYEIDLASVLKYLVSFRRENHFHEEVAEMIYKRLWDRFHPSKLMVAAMYTRRGGIDINPIRASHTALIDPAFTAVDARLAKNYRQ